MSTTLTEQAIQPVETADGVCPECGTPPRTDPDETYCPDCGLVIEEHAVDYNDETAVLNQAAYAELHHDRGLGNGFIGMVERDGTKRISKSEDRLRTWNRRILSGSGRERNLDYAHGEVKRLGEALSLSITVQQQAGRLCRQASENGVTNGHDLDGIAAASVLIAARIDGAPVTRTGVLAYARCTELSLSIGFDAMKRGLGLAIPPASPVTFVGQVTDRLGLDPEIRKAAEELAAAVAGTVHMSGRKPSGMAAACVYVAANEAGVDVTQVEAGNAGDCHKKTVRSNRDVILEVTA